LFDEVDGDGGILDTGRLEVVVLEEDAEAGGQLLAGTRATDHSELADNSKYGE